MNLAASGTLDTVANVQYICMLFHGEELRQFDSLSDDVESTEPLNVEYIIKGLALYFFPVNLLSKQKRAMRRGMKKLCSLKVRRYADPLIFLNGYFDFLPEAILPETIGVTELNEILLNSMPNSCSKKSYV